MTWRFFYVSATQPILTKYKLWLWLGFLSLITLAFILQPVLAGYAAGQDGTVDLTFNSSGIGPNRAIRAMAIQSDDKILISGNFTSYNGTEISLIARLNSDGTLDTSFNPGTGVDSTIHDMTIQRDGKILIVGNFTSYNSTPRSHIARLDSDGNLDTSFDPNNIATNGSLAVSLAIQNDGKILVGGFIQNQIMRLNTDGSRDTTFLGGADNLVYRILVQNNDKIIIQGWFTMVNSVPRSGITRLNSDGSLDITFKPEVVYNTLALQSDGKIIMAGNFTDSNGVSHNTIARLNPDGSLDTTFNVSILGNGNSVSGAGSAVVQSDGKIIIGGEFTTVNGYNRANLARLEGTIKTVSNVTLVSDQNPSQLGQNVTFTATVSPITATGTVKFTFGTASNAPTATIQVVNGVATYVTSTLPAGDTLVKATYSGDDIFAYNSTVYTQSVTKLGSSVAITSSANPALVSTNLVLTATLTPVTVSGVVTFSFEGNGNGVSSTISSPVVNGITEYVTNTLAVGFYTVTATYGGDASYSSSASPPYAQQIIADCTKPIVTSATDDGQATTCGTLSYALGLATNGTISFELVSGGGNTITFTGSLTPMLKAGVAIDGGANGIVLNGNGVAGNGLTLGGGNTLTNLTIRNFGGQELLATLSSAANHLFRVKVQS